MEISTKDFVEILKGKPTDFSEFIIGTYKDRMLVYVVSDFKSVAFLKEEIKAIEVSAFNVEAHKFNSFLIDFEKELNYVDGYKYRFASGDDYEMLKKEGLYSELLKRKPISYKAHAMLNPVTKQPDYFALIVEENSKTVISEFPKTSRFLSKNGFIKVLKGEEVEGVTEDDIIIGEIERDNRKAIWFVSDFKNVADLAKDTSLIETRVVMLKDDKVAVDNLFYLYTVDLDREASMNEGVCFMYHIATEEEKELYNKKFGILDEYKKLHNVVYGTKILFDALTFDEKKTIYIVNP